VLTLMILSQKEWE